MFKLVIVRVIVLVLVLVLVVGVVERWVVLLVSVNCQCLRACVLFSLLLRQFSFVCVLLPRVAFVLLPDYFNGFACQSLRVASPFQHLGASRGNRLPSDNRRPVCIFGLRASVFL